MNVDLIFQIAGLGIVVAVLNQLLSRAGRDEMALLITIAGLVAALVIVASEIGDLFGTIKSIFNL
ncbi:MAG TPA: stage III sporulation protein AC [Candidatus Ornithomonoglobus intestinigallinarum]|uniref:Stage III sporulation protein AC n=1 Tax=Candidatus Ornithomonoglobus intestinigallinarum TaxID=2840894 RepID=A0A9D1H3N7_9FIRM|nr:stage III sporulation protein AC [Candidatus Ornithomonoglobus intestinigallinarum]